MAQITQASIVYEHLKRYGKITSMEAFGMYGITRLSARIFELRERGCKIETKKKQTVSRIGHNTNYAEYRLIEE